MGHSAKLSHFSPKFKILYRAVRHIVLLGGRGSGKSWNAVMALIFYAVTYNIRILCTREIQNSIRESSYRLILNTIERMGLSEYFEATRDEIRCLTTGSVFIFKGLRDAQTIKSLENIQLCLVEEAQTVSDESIKILTPTIRGKNSKIIWLFNPRYETDAVYDMFLVKKPPPNTLIEKINFNENPHCPKELIEEAKHMEEVDFPMYKHVWLGECVSLGDNKIFNTQAISEAVNRTPVLDPNAPVIAAIDLARMGRDSSVLCIRQGNLVRPLKKWQGLDVEPVVDAVVGEVLSNQIDVLIVDAAGLGVAHLTLLRSRIGNICKVVEYNSASAPTDRKKFTNARAETHFLCKEAMAELAIPNDTELRKQLINIEYGYHKTNNKLKVELKEDYKDRNGGSSPDELDALTMTFYKGYKVRELDKSKLKLRRR